MIAFENKNTKWWYRLLQVIYTMFSVCLVIFGVASFIAPFPTLNPDESTYQLKCTDGTLRGDFQGELLNYNFDDFKEKEGRDIGRIACENTKMSGDEIYDLYTEEHILKLRGAAWAYENKDIMTVEEMSEFEIKGLAKTVPEAKNYTLVIKEKVYEGNWWEPLMAFVVSLVTIPLLLLSIRAVFLYIVFGTPFKQSFSPLRRLRLPFKG